MKSFRLTKVGAFVLASMPAMHLSMAFDASDLSAGRLFLNCGNTSLA